MAPVPKYVYIARAPSGWRKIGMTKNHPSKRMVMLAYNNSFREKGPFVLEFYVMCFFPSQVEKTAHKTLKQFRGKHVYGTIRGLPPEYFDVDFETARAAVMAAVEETTSGAEPVCLVDSQA